MTEDLNWHFFKKILGSGKITRIKAKVLIRPSNK